MSKNMDINIIRENIYKKIGRSCEVFIPAVTSSIRDTHRTIYYIDGYMFIEYKHDINYNKILEYEVVEHILTDLGTRNYSFISDKEIQKMKEEMDIKIKNINRILAGDEVVVVSGTYKNIQGIVTKIDGDTAYVEISLRSGDRIIDFPLNYLTKYDIQQ